MKEILLKAIDEYDFYNAAIGTKIANKYYKNLPDDDVLFLCTIEPLIYESDIRLFSIATQWLKKRKTVLDMKHMSIYEKWIDEGIHGWGECDQFCYRLMNPMLVKYPEVYDYIKKWTDQDNFTYKRIGLITFNGSSGTVASSFEAIEEIVNKLKTDDDKLIQKAVGWVLKDCYKKHPDALESYLRAHVHSMSRTTFRYALERMPKNLKQALMKL